MSAYQSHPGTERRSVRTDDELMSKNPSEVYEDSDKERKRPSYEHDEASAESSLCQRLAGTSIDLEHATKLIDKGNMSPQQLDATIKRLEKKKSSKQMDVRNGMWKAVLCRFASRKKCLSTARECFYAHGKADMRSVHLSRLKDAGIDTKTGRPTGSTVVDVMNIISDSRDNPGPPDGDHDETRGRSRSIKEGHNTYQVGSDAGLRILLALPGVNRDYLKSRLTRRNRWSRGYRQKGKRKQNNSTNIRSFGVKTEKAKDVEPEGRERSNSWYSSTDKNAEYYSYSAFAASWPDATVFDQEALSLSPAHDDAHTFPSLASASLMDREAAFAMSIASHVLDETPKGPPFGEPGTEDAWYPSLNDVSDLFSDSLQRELYHQGPVLHGRGSSF
eukprot:gb/GECG01015686.1/.p1 GENE.gb/GECG01015686.1/~~gb/GECG01015686.1/.p1  ORF type:complete len:389 (+),score=46.83 gb/GECG01015686.1/:1-1167(+)